MFGKGHLPPDGWTISGGRQEEVPTVAGYYQRRCEVKGICRTRDCRRTAWLDYEHLAKEGMGLLYVRDVQRTLACGRLGGCSIVWHEEPARVIRLRELKGRPYVAAEMHCTACGKRHITTMEALINRLKAEDLGDETTPLKAVGGLIKTPCACGLTRWAVYALWYSPDGGKVPSWKQDLDRRMETKRRRQNEVITGSPR